MFSEPVHVLVGKKSREHRIVPRVQGSSVSTRPTTSWKPRPILKRTLQWRVEICIKSPVPEVWRIIDDLTLITAYHPEVRKVEFQSGSTTRAVGVRYRCEVPERKFWCVEEVIEHVPNDRTTIAFPEDSMGMSKRFRDFTSELSVRSEPGDTTRLRLDAHYEPIGFLLRAVNALFLRRVMRVKALRTLEGLKRLAEKERL